MVGSDGGEIVVPRLPERIPSSTTDRIMSLSQEGGSSDGQGRTLVYFRGHVDEARLARAVELAMEAEPVLGYRFASEARVPCWQRPDGEEREAPFSIEPVPPSGIERSPFLWAPLSPQRPPQVRVGLFRSRDDVMCVRINHVVMDGGGVIAYLALLSSLYRALEADPHHRPAVNLARARGPREVLRRGGLLPAVRGLGTLRLPGLSWGIEGGDDRTGRAFMCRHIGPERLQALRAYARGQGATMNDVVLAAFYRALFAVADPPRGRPLRIEVPVNLRRYLPPGGEGFIGNLSGVYFPCIDRRDGEGFEDTLRRVHRAVEGKKRRREELAQMLFIETALLPGMSAVRTLAKATGFEVANPVLSNLGVIDPAVVDFGSAVVEDVRMLGPVHFPPNVGMGVSTFREVMTVSLIYSDTAVSPRTLERLLDAFLAELPGGPEGAPAGSASEDP